MRHKLDLLCFLIHKLLYSPVLLNMALEYHYFSMSEVLLVLSTSMHI